MEELFVRWGKRNGPMVVPKPVRREKSAAGNETTDSSRDEAALRNDNSLGFSDYFAAELGWTAEGGRPYVVSDAIE